MNYEASIDRKMDKIAQTVGRLDNTLAEMQGSGGRVKCFYEQKKALHEIKSILRKSDSIQENQLEWAEDELNGADNAFGIETPVPNDFFPSDVNRSPQDKAIDSIETALMHLEDDLQDMDGCGTDEDYSKHEAILQNIKQALRESGHYGAPVQ